MSRGVIYRYPTKDRNRNRLWVRFKRIDFEWDESSGNMKATSGAKQPSVYLYLPASISLKDGLSYNTSAELGIVGRAIEAGINDIGTRPTSSILERGAQALDIMTTTVTDAIRVGQALATGNETVNPAMVALTMRRFGNFDRSAYGSAVRSGIRNTVNPHRRALFESVNLREFSFNFEFAPDNPDEAREVEQIVQFLRETAYPTLSSLDPNSIREAGDVPREDDEEGDDGTFADVIGDVADSLVYKFPSMIKVDMFYELSPEAYQNLESIQERGVNIEQLIAGNKVDEILSTGLLRIGPRIKPCYITGIDRTLDNQNAMVYRALGNKAVPVSQTLSISLSEDRPISGEDIRKGF